MKNIKFLFIIIFLVTGCQKLEETPYSFLNVSNLYQNEEDVDKALLGVYQSLFQNGINDLWFFLSLSGPSENLRVRLKAGAQGRFSTVNFFPSDPHAGIWNNFYEGINRANTFIANVSKANLEPDLEEQKIAEARFLRAFYYFYLGHMYGGVPLHLEPTTAFDDESVKKPRASLDEVYQVVIDDLLFAEDLLPISWPDAEAGRATSGAAKSLLGKVYLTMAGKPLEQTDKYEMAASKLKEVVGNYSLLSNYSAVFDIGNEFNSEIIFARPNISNVNGSGTVLTFFAGAPDSPFAFNGGQYQIGITEDLYNSYDENDERRDVTTMYNYTNRNGVEVSYKPSGEPTPGLQFGGPRAPSGIPFGKLKDPSNELNPFGHGNDIIYIRYADVLLMLSEALNESGQSIQGLPYLNEVRERAGLEPVLTTDQAELRKIIKQERKWELAGEYVEYFDLQRWGDLNESISENPDALQLGVTYDPKVELFPIPQNELDANENLVQNPGY